MRHSRAWYKARHIKTILTAVQGGKSCRRYVALRMQASKETAHAHFFRNEFKILASDSRISGLYVGGDSDITFYARITVRQRRRTFLLGVYRIHIGNPTKSNNSNNWWVKVVQSGRKDNKKAPYFADFGLHGFCFGVRKEYLEGLYQQGEIFQLIQSILESLASIETSDRGHTIAVEQEYMEVSNG